MRPGEAQGLGRKEGAEGALCASAPRLAANRQSMVVVCLHLDCPCWPAGHLRQDWISSALAHMKCYAVLIVSTHLLQDASEGTVPSGSSAGSAASTELGGVRSWPRRFRRSAAIGLCMAKLGRRGLRSPASIIR